MIYSQSENSFIYMNYVYLYFAITSRNITCYVKLKKKRTFFYVLIDKLNICFSNIKSGF